MRRIRALVRRVPRGWIARSATGVFAFRVTQGAVGFATTLLLARMLGPAGYGAYAIVLSTMWLLAVVGGLGFRTLLVRGIARYHTREDWGLLRGILRRSNQLVLSASLALCLLTAAVVLGAGTALAPDLRAAFWLGLVILPLSALTGLRQATLEGLQRVLEARATEMLLQPLAFLVLAIVAYLAVADLTAAGAMTIRVAATTLAFAVGAAWARRLLPPAVRTAAPVYATRGWLRDVLPLVAIAMTNIVRDRTPVLMLGALAGRAAAGLFTVATGVTDVIGFVFLAMNAPIAPAVAGLHAVGNVTQLQRLATTSARFTVALSLPLAGILVAFGGPILQQFGPDFIQARPAVIILALAHLANVSLGSVAVVLTMTGHERDVFKGSLLSTLLNVGLSAALIPAWGVEGAAVAVAVSRLAGSLAIGGLVYARLRIDPTALGWLRARRLPETDR